jgi:hypothetical protein
LRTPSNLKVVPQSFTYWPAAATILVKTHFYLIKNEESFTKLKALQHDITITTHAKIALLHECCCNIA